MSENEAISLERFLEDKTDYSHLLVHLTRSDEGFEAKDILSMILDSKTLKAYHVWSICQYDVDSQENEILRNKLKVVCFTETPLEQIKVILKPLEGRHNQPEPYGLVFTKEYIRKMGGNPVFYLTKEISKPLLTLFRKYKEQLTPQMCQLFALTNICDVGNDWHWEREWRVVGDLIFTYDNVYCGLCPEEHIQDFQKKYKQVKFIDPNWSSKKLVDALVKKEPQTIDINDLPF
jgi:hypothetical protein